MGEARGPFAGANDSPMDGLYSSIKGFSSALAAMLEIILTPYFFMGCFVLALLFYNLLRYRNGMLLAYQEEQSSGQQVLVMQLQAKLKTQNAANGRLRRQTQLMRRSLAQQQSDSWIEYDADGGKNDEDALD